METKPAGGARYAELDLMKAFTVIICMIPVHVWLAHTDTFETTFTFIVDSVLGGLFAAPVFMFCMGMGFVFTRHNSPSEMSWRGIKLLTFGAALSILVTVVPYLIYKLTPFDNVYAATLPSFSNTEEALIQSLPTILTVDIMQLAGLSFLFFALLKKLGLGPRAIFLISIPLCIIGTMSRLRGFHLENQILNHLLGLLVMSYGASCFPLFTWFIFIAGGNLFGTWYKNVRDKGKLFRWLVPAGLVLTSVYVFLPFLVEGASFEMFDNEESFYGMIALDAVRVVIFIPTLIGLWWLASKAVPQKWMNVLCYPSRHINQYYMVSWTWICLLMGVMRAIGWVTTDWLLVVDSTLVIALTTVTVSVYNKRFKACCEAAISARKYVWMSAVWCIWLGSIVLCNL